MGRRFAEKIFEIIPPILQVIRQDLRGQLRADITLSQYRVLAGLETQKLTMNELADRIGVSMPAMSRMVVVLSKKGYVVKSVPPKDRRQIHISITAKGLKYCEEVRQAAQEQFARRFDHLSTRAIARLEEALEVIGKAFVIEEEWYEASQRSRSVANNDDSLRTRAKHSR